MTYPSSSSLKRCCIGSITSDWGFGGIILPLLEFKHSTYSFAKRINVLTSRYVLTILFSVLFDGSIHSPNTRVGINRSGIISRVSRLKMCFTIQVIVTAGLL